MTMDGNEKQIAALRTEVEVMKVKIAQMERDIVQIEEKSITTKTVQPYIRLFWVIVGAVVTGLLGFGISLLSRGM